MPFNASNSVDPLVYCYMKQYGLYVLLSTVWVSIATLSSCNLFPKEEPYECPDRTDYYQLSEDQKRILPYTGYDTIRFVSNTGDTLTCIGQGKQYFSTQKFEPYSDPGCGNHGTYSNYEAYKIEFVDAIQNEKIELIHYDFALTGRYKGGSTIYVTYKNGNGATSDYQISRPTASNFLGSIEISGLVYNNVTKAESDPLDTAQFVLVNKTDGILKIQLNNTESWEFIQN